MCITQCKTQNITCNNVISCVLHTISTVHQVYIRCPDCVTVCIYQILMKHCVNSLQIFFLHRVILQLHGVIWVCIQCVFWGVYGRVYTVYFDGVYTVYIGVCFYVFTQCNLSVYTLCIMLYILVYLHRVFWSRIRCIFWRVFTRCILMCIQSVSFSLRQCYECVITLNILGTHAT